jgi:hypothetical protein
MAMMVDVEGPSRPVLRMRNRPLRLLNSGPPPPKIAAQFERRGGVIFERCRISDRGSAGGWKRECILQDAFDRLPTRTLADGSQINTTADRVPSTDCALS